MSHSNVFRIAPSVLVPLGMEQLQDPALAILELVKNSWDADAELVIVEITESNGQFSVSVEDDGSGMSADTFAERWLLIGSSFKRKDQYSANGRAMIGEKGLGRLATFSLGSSVEIKSTDKPDSGFGARIDWAALMDCISIDDYAVATKKIRKKTTGTLVTIDELSIHWESKHTDYLVEHLQYLISVPNEKFEVVVKHPLDETVIESPALSMDSISEVTFEATVDENGAPSITKCEVNGIDRAGIQFKELSLNQQRKSFVGMCFSIQYFNRNSASNKLKNALGANQVDALLESYQGVRIYVDGVNVPPYGLKGDDWARLDKQRTSTGGPTMVPGNSQLFGEVRISKKTHTDFVVTAGRSGFSNHQTVEDLVAYVRWVARCIGTARRAETYDIDSGKVPGRSKPKDKKEKPNTSVSSLKKALDDAAQTKAVKEDEGLQNMVTASQNLLDEFVQNQETLRLYAQLASTGIASTSFAHELRTEFDVMSSSVKDLRSGLNIDEELIGMIGGSWSSIRSFASLFQVMPVKIRRKLKSISSSELETAANSVTKLAESQGIDVDFSCEIFQVRIVPAEFDSILLNLISNSLKAIKGSSNRKNGLLAIQISRQKKSMILSVLDNGSGVSDKVADVMFLPLEGAFAEGTGMGLPIVQFLASQYKGDLSFSTPTDRNYSTEFRVVFNNVVEPLS